MPFDILAEVRPARSIDTRAYPILMFATSVRTPVEVKRSKGVNIVISPEDRQEFIEKVQQAVARDRDIR